MDYFSLEDRNIVEPCSLGLKYTWSVFVNTALYGLIILSFQVTIYGHTYLM